jgi:hypothetical protein
MMNKPSPFNLTSETALITGGGTGLGLGMAKCLADAGARVVLVGRREAELKAAAKETGPNASWVAHDITQLKRAGELIKSAEKAAGAPVSILINNAGIHLKKTATETTPEEFQSVLTTHVCAAQALVAAVLPGMLSRAHGHILFTASMASFIGMPLIIGYSAAKSAYLGMVRPVAACASMLSRRDGSSHPCCARRSTATPRGRIKSWVARRWGVLVSRKTSGTQPFIFVPPLRNSSPAWSCPWTAAPASDFDGPSPK